MGSFHIPLGRKIPVSAILSDMPAGAKSIIRRGFSVIARLPESAHPTLLKATVASAGQRNLFNEERLAKELNISTEDATNAMAALGVFSALSSTSSEDPEQLLQKLVESGLVLPPDRPNFARMLPQIRQISPEVQKAVAIEGLKNAILPSFDDFEALLDIRIGDQERGGFAIPVAIAFLDTDARDEHLWFQLTRQDVERLLEKLNSLLKRFKEAEEVIEKWPSASKGT